MTLLLLLACSRPPAPVETTAAGPDAPTSSPALTPPPRRVSTTAAASVSVRTEITAVDIDGEGLDEAQKGVRRYRGRIQACAEREAGKDALPLPSTLAIDADIAAGRVVEARARSARADLSSCVERAVRTWRFDQGVEGTLRADFALSG